MNVNCTLKGLEATIDTTPHQIIVAHCTSNVRLAIEIDRWLTIPTPRDNKLCHFFFFSYNVVKKEANLMLECFLYLYNSGRDRFPSLFHNVVRPFQFASNWTSKLILEAIAFRYSMQIAFFPPSLSPFSPISLSASRLENRFHFNSLSRNIIFSSVEHHLHIHSIKISRPNQSNAW